jgi:hypothetical protein
MITEISIKYKLEDNVPRKHASDREVWLGCSLAALATVDEDFQAFLVDHAADAARQIDGVTSAIPSFTWDGEWEMTVEADFEEDEHDNEDEAFARRCEAESELEEAVREAISDRFASLDGDDEGMQTFLDRSLAHVAPEDVTDAVIEKWRVNSANAGIREAAAVCDRADEGDEEAIAEIARWEADALASREGAK